MQENPTPLRSIDQLLPAGARVWHYGGCRHCPEYQHVGMAAIVGRMGGTYPRPQNLICPACKRDLLPASGCWIYFIQASSGDIKIGLATDLVKRIDGLQVGHPHPFRLLAVTYGDKSLEAEFHDQYADHRGFYGEWFYPAEYLLKHLYKLTYVDLPFHEFRDAIKESN